MVKASVIRRRAQAGLSMVELMVAVTVGLILLAGVAQIFINSKAAYKVQGGSGLLHENARYAMNKLGYDIHMAGHWGGLQPDELSGTPAVASGLSSDCDLSWIYDAETPAQGYQGAATPPLDCIDADDYVAGTDVLTLRFAEGVPTKNAGVSSSGIYLRSSVGRLGKFVSASEITNGTTGIANADGTYNYLYRPVLYYLRSCGVVGTSGSCSNALDSTPTLVRKTLNGDQFQTEPMVEHVEHMQLMYGLDTDVPKDGIVDRYVSAGAVTNWQDLLSVRVNLIVRNPERQVDYEDTRTYNLPDGNTYSPPADMQNHMRKQFDAFFHIRNLSTLS
jgi:type IV pilus assembly protein PilW